MDRAVRRLTAADAEFVELCRLRQCASGHPSLDHLLRLPVSPHLLYYAHKLDAQRINIKWRAWL